MNKDFINATRQTAIYKLKEGTKGSYYWFSGSRCLPNRISLSIGGEYSKVQKKGRNLQDAIAGQLISTFKVCESSPLKMFRPYCCRTQIWQKAEYPALFGYGTLGITGEDGRIFDTKDLIVLRCNSNCDIVKVHIFNGLGTPDAVLDVMGFVNELEKGEFEQVSINQEGRL